MRFSLAVKNAFDHSAALDSHIAKSVANALGPYSWRIDKVELRLSDINGPRHGRGDKVTSVDITLRPAGHVMARASAEDVYDSVRRAARRARRALDRHVSRLDRRRRRPARALSV